MNAPIDAGLAEALATLGLRPDADARSVKRAYAQQVKQIDQATQLQEFQTLREAYELALAVIRRQETQAQDAAPAPLPAEAAEQAEPLQPTPPAARAEFAPPDSAELARAVFQGFAARADAGFKEEAEATAALQDALADDRLLNLEARMLFELQVAHRIMEGWQPGHEFLFGPACEVFHWESDRSHLRVFGQLGGALDAAINEKLIFFRQAPGDFDLQRSVIRRLRQAEMPSVKLRRADLPLVQMLVQRYPNWLRLITSQANINTWFSDLSNEPAATAADALAPPLPPAQAEWQQPAGAKWPWLFAVLVVLMLGRMLTISGSDRPSFGHPMPNSAADPAPAGERYTNSWPAPVGTGKTTSAPFDLGGGTAGQPPYGWQPPTTQQSTNPYGLPPPSALPASPQSPGATPRTTMVWTVPKPPTEDVVRLGHVTFALLRDRVVVQAVGPSTSRSAGTLQVGDRLMRCLLGDGRRPISHTMDVKQCTGKDGSETEPGVTPYVYRVWRNGESTSASLTLREAGPSAASTPN